MSDISNKNKLCSHIPEKKLIDLVSQIISDLNQKICGDELIKNKIRKTNNGYLCLSCAYILYYNDDLNKHCKTQNHKIYLNILKSNIFCQDCNSEYLLSKKDIYEIKYKQIINNFKNKKYSKILFMTGAGISTSSGIPDFKSDNGFFKKLLGKYNLSEYSQFFYKSTYLKSPGYFYEFSKLFNSEEIKPTISHKFINFLNSKKLIKYIYTTNIDGLEKRAKIPDEKVVYVHGNFHYGECINCHAKIEIQKINEKIKNEEIYFCSKCKGPCKPNIVFYGENYPLKFYNSLNECKDIELIIIMGTTLKVHPFADIPYYTNPKADILMFNMEEIEGFYFDELIKPHFLIKGKNDETIIQFLRDIDMLDEFKNFIKNEYN